MAKYGSNRYGAGFKYGESTTVSVYYNSGISAWSYDYGTIRLSWSPITQDPTENAPTHWKLVKSYTGLPDNPDDGQVLAGGLYSTFLTSYVDLNYDSAGLEANYSIWVFNGDRWIFCGSDFAVVVGDRDSLNKLTAWLPKAWTNPINAVGEALGEDNDNTFMSLIKAYAFVYDKLRTEAALLGNANDRLYIPGTLLKYRVQDFGFNYEPALGDSYHRSIFGAANAINSYKGTSLGIGIYTTALTHWADEIIIGHNLMLNYNDSSFEESIGNWGSGFVQYVGGSATPSISPMTLTHHKYADSFLEFGTALTPPSPGLYDRVFTPRDKGFMVYQGTQATYAQAKWFRLPAEDGSPLSSTTLRDVKKGIPVTPGKRYVFSGWARSKNARPTSGAQYLAPAVNNTVCYIAILFFDRNNNFIEQSAHGTPLWFTNTWKEFHSGRIDNGIEYTDRVGHLAPPDAAYAAVRFYAETDHVLGGLYFDMFQFAEAEKSYEFEDARRIQVHVKGQKENYLPNPDFAEGLGSWSALNGDIRSDSSNTSALLLGNHSAKVISTGSGTAGFVTDWVPSEPGRIVTFSAYVLADSEQDAIARIEFSSLSTTDQQAAILSDVDGLYYPTTINYVDSEPVTVNGTDLTHITVSGIIPPYTRDAGNPSVKMSIYFPDNTVGDEFWIDGVLLEEKDTPSDYYSGDGGVFPEDPITQTFYSASDCFWEIKNTTNYVSNPSFQTNTTDWTAVTGTLTRVATDGSYNPLYGTHFGKLSFTTSGAVSVTSYLDAAAIGGEDYTFSVYVRGAVGTYTLGSSTFVIDSNNYLNWTRISNVVQLTKNQTTVVTSISFTKASGSTSTYFHLDGAQLEKGRIASQFVDPQAANSAVVTVVNPTASSKNMYLTQAESAGGGTSSYFNNYTTKFARLRDTIPLVVPEGSSWCIKTGAVSTDYQDLEESLIPSASFEKSLGSWVGKNSSLTRLIARGSLFNDTLTHGQAYCRVSSSTAATFGIKVEKVALNPNGGYYASVAIKPVNAVGTYTLTARFYDANDSEIVVYTDNVTGRYTTSSLDQLGASNTLATTAARTKAVTITDTTRWAYLANTFPVSSITGASYANISVDFTSSGSYTSGQSFYIDRAVFRQ
jgi:hypothetical protein